MGVMDALNVQDRIKTSTPIPLAFPHQQQPAKNWERVNQALYAVAIVMQALQADIARLINKRAHPDPASDSDFDSETSIQELLRPTKRIRYSPKRSSRPSNIPPILGPNVRVSPSPSASSYSIINDNNERRPTSSDTSQETSTSDESSNDEESSPSISSRTVSQSDHDTDSTSSDEEDDSAPLYYADPRTVTNSDSESSSTDNENSSGEDDTEDFTSTSDDSTLSLSEEEDGSSSTSSSNGSTPFPRPPLSVNFLQNSHTPIKPTLVTELAKTRPVTFRPQTRTNDTGPNLKSRLNALLPKMRDANAELEVERREGRLGERDIEALGEEEEATGYVEMNLGLGVLEEKKKKKKKKTRERGEGLEEADAGNAGKGSSDVGMAGDEERALPALMPVLESQGKVGIEVVEEGV